MENLRKKNLTEILERKKFLKSNKSWKPLQWLEQVEDRISGLEDKIDIRGKKNQKNS
jgi:hypothetical protein